MDREIETFKVQADNHVRFYRLFIDPQNFIDVFPFPPCHKSAEVLLAKIGFTRSSPWKDLDWGWEAEFVRINDSQ